MYPFLKKQYYHKKSPELLGSSGFFIYLCKQLVELHAARREGNCWWQWGSEPVRMPETYRKKAYFALCFWRLEILGKFQALSESTATICPTGYVYAYPNCALAKAMAHDGCILHIGVGSLIVARLDNAGRFLGASNRQTSDRMRLPLFVYMVRTITNWTFASENSQARFNVILE